MSNTQEAVPQVPADTKPGGKVNINRNKRNNNYRRNRGNPRVNPANADLGKFVQGKPTFEVYEKVASHIKELTTFRPKLAIICGSGLGALAGHIKEPVVLPYSSIPLFEASTVAGHAGELVFGLLGGVEVVAMKGRFHPYEGYPMWKVAFPVRVFKLLGVTTLIASNAAGSCRSDWKVGDIMMIKDHVNFLGFANVSPLQGPNIDEFGPRFPPLNKAYDKNLRSTAKSVISEMCKGDTSFLREGVYTGLGGPTYETIAEVKFLQFAGVDAVGMSTVQEVIVAAHCGMKVFAFSLITNVAVVDYDNENEPNHAEVIEAAARMEPIITEFAEKFASAIKDQL